MRWPASCVGLTCESGGWYGRPSIGTRRIGGDGNFGRRSLAFGSRADHWPHCPCCRGAPFHSGSLSFLTAPTCHRHDHCLSVAHRTTPKIFRSPPRSDVFAHRPIQRVRLGQLLHSSLPPREVDIAMRKLTSDPELRHFSFVPSPSSYGHSDSQGARAGPINDLVEGYADDSALVDHSRERGRRVFGFCWCFGGCSIRRALCNRSHVARESLVHEDPEAPADDVVLNSPTWLYPRRSYRRGHYVE